MGAGGRSIPPTSSTKPTQSNRSPSDKPPFTLSQLKKSIPPHCFQRSLLKSLSYLLLDLTLTSILFYLTTFFPLLPKPLQILSWVAYILLQGSVLTGVWVIAHECGHHAFSDYPLIDDTIGLIFHSLLLVPYFSWKFSHRRHHSNTGSLLKDEVFVPKTRSHLPSFSKHLNNPPGRLLTLLITLTLGWPLYLLFNVSGRPYPRLASHFDPFSPIYSPRERSLILLSDLSIITVLILLFKLTLSYGLTYILCLYGMPLVIVNGFLVMITFLQHTHPALPHYDETEWDWMRGALATVDRDYGVLNRVLHNITDTHVAHHLFSTMPHYHAMEATKAIRPILGKYYQFDGTPFYKALWREAKECLFVEADEGAESKGIYWYRNKV